MNRSYVAITIASLTFALLPGCYQGDADPAFDQLTVERDSSGLATVRARIICSGIGDENCTDQYDLCVTAEWRWIAPSDGQRHLVTSSERCFRRSIQKPENTDELDFELVEIQSNEPVDETAEWIVYLHEKDGPTTYSTNGRIGQAWDGDMDQYTRLGPGWQGSNEPQAYDP